MPGVMKSFVFRSSSIQPLAHTSLLQVTMAVNITVDQQQAAFQQATVVDPVTTFLGDHVASVQLATSAPTSTGQVQASCACCQNLYTLPEPARTCLGDRGATTQLTNNAPPPLVYISPIVCILTN